MMVHKSVLLQEVLQYLDPKPNENFIDCTIGEGGHSFAILEENKPHGRVLGIEWDAQVFEELKLKTADYKFSNRFVLVNDSYANLKEIVEKINFKPINGILLDLGYSSWQLENSKRGFSFMKNEILDMRYSMKNTLTAQKIVNEYPEGKISKILDDYGEEKFSKQIAKKITEERKFKKIESTFDLKEIIKEAIPTKFRHGRIHFATRSFQALRIAVNYELDNLAKVLPEVLSVLSSQGRLVVISFHSLEDRIVKNFFKNKAEEGKIKILNKKPITASYKEVSINPRSRSAKLRAIAKI